MNYCFKAYGTAFLRGRFTIKKFMRLKVRIACDPIVYLKPYCMPLREDGHDGNWLIGGSFIKFRFWMNGEFISCGPLRATADDTRVIHEFEFDELSSGEHLLAVAFRGERDGISIELIPDKGTAPEIDWKIFDARLFCSPVAWKHPNIYGYFKGDIGPGEYFEHLDGTLYPDNWNNAFYFNDAKWETPQIAETELKNHSAEYNYEQEYQFPSKLWKNSRGNYIVDFETVAVGSVRLKGPHVGGEIELRLGEELLNGDCVRYQYRCGICSQEIWTFKAGGQTLEHFGVRTFRYVEIVGYQGEMRITDLGRLLIRAPFRDVAELKTPVKALTDIWQLCKNSVRNIGVDYFVDCFTRERLAYEADTLLVMGSSFVMNADLRLVKRTLEQLLNHPTWPCEWSQLMTKLFYDYYMETGDRDFIREHFRQLLGYSSYRHLIRNGMICRFPLQVLIDWPPVYRESYDCGNEEFLTVPNALACKILLLLSELANEIGESSLSAELSSESRDMALAIHKRCFDPEVRLYRDHPGSEQHSFYATLWALWSDVIPEVHVAHAVDFIERSEIPCSLYSAYFYLETLFRYGRGARAFSLLADQDSKWLEMLRNGLTVTSEYWYDSEQRMSLAHPWGAYPAYLIARYVFGVRSLEPGWKKFAIEPDQTFHCPGALTMIRNGTVIHAERH